MLKKIITYIICLSGLISLKAQDSKQLLENHFSLKVGVNNMFLQMKDEPYSGGRGFGCSYGNTIKSGGVWLGGIVGVSCRFEINHSFSVIVGSEISIPINTYKKYLTSFWCAGNTQSETDGELSSTKPSLIFPVLLRYKVPSQHFFIELGVFHDLGFSPDIIYKYTETTYRNYMHVPYPEPIVEHSQEGLASSNSGLCLGLGMDRLFHSEKYEVKLLLNLGTSKFVPLGEYSHVRQRGIDLSVHKKL